MVFGLRDMLDLFAIKVDFLEKLEEQDDVQKVFTNIDVPDEAIAKN